MLVYTGGIRRGRGLESLSCISNEWTMLFLATRRSSHGCKLFLTKYRALKYKGQGSTATHRSLGFRSRIRCYSGALRSTGIMESYYVAYKLFEADDVVVYR